LHFDYLDYVACRIYTLRSCDGLKDFYTFPTHFLHSYRRLLHFGTVQLSLRLAYFQRISYNSLLKLDCCERLHIH